MRRITFQINDESLSLVTPPNCSLILREEYIKQSNIYRACYNLHRWGENSQTMICFFKGVLYSNTALSTKDKNRFKDKHHTFKRLSLKQLVNAYYAVHGSLNYRELNNLCYILKHWKES